MKKKLGTFVLAFGLLLSNIETVNASVYLSYGSESLNTDVASYNYIEPWTTIINNGRSAWNSLSIGTNISTSYSSNNKILVGEYNDTWCGLYSPNSYTGSYVTKYTIYINAKVINENATDIQKYGQSVVAHEFGHVFFLADNPADTSSAKDFSLMNHARNREKVVRPTGFDSTNVANKYS